MKPLNKSKDKKQKNKNKPKIKVNKEKVLVVAQEIKLARLLSGNDKKTRDRVLKTLTKWLTRCFEKEYEFTEEDFIRVWKGLFYAVWMSDKPLVQEDLCETIAGILDLFPVSQIKYALLLVKAGFRVLATEWYGIDQHRLDKYMMMVRRYLRGSLRCLRRCEWQQDVCRLYCDTLAGKDGILALKTPHYARNAGSMVMHIVDCFLEELAKVSDGDIPEDSIPILLRPFCEYMCSGENPIVVVGARRVIAALLRQSQPALEHRERTAAWKKMGCPPGGPDALEPVSDEESSDDEIEPNDEDDEMDPSDERPLDPRAGRVDVELALLPVPAGSMAALLRELMAGVGSKAYKRLQIYAERFEQLERDEHPFKAEEVYEQPETRKRPQKSTAASRLSALENKLVDQSDEIALRGLSRKHRKRLLATARSGQSIVELLQKEKIATNGNWKVEPANTKDQNTPETNNKRDNKRKRNQKSTNKHNKKQKINSVSEATINDVQENANIEKKDANKVKLVNGGSKISTNVKVKKDAKEPVEKPAKVIKDSKFEKNSSNSVKLFNGVAKDNKKKMRKSNNEDNETKGNTKTEVRNNLIEEHRAKLNEAIENNINVKNKEASKNGVKPSAVVSKLKKFQKKIDEKREVKANMSLRGSGKANMPLRGSGKANGPVRDNAKANVSFDTPKRVKFVLKNNSMQKPVDYYKSVRQSPNIPFDSTKQPIKTNLKPSTPSPINPFFKKKLRLK